MDYNSDLEKFSIHGLIIRKHIDVLLNGINLSEILPYLYAKRLVSEEEWLSNPVTPLDARSATEQILARLISKESTREEYLAFIQCLKDSSGHVTHGELADILEQPFLDEEEEADRAIAVSRQKSATPISSALLGKRSIQSEGTQPTYHQKRKRCNNVLPSRPSIFLGRQDMVTEVIGCFGDGQHVLTLVGFPGVGKTTLAIAIAHEASINQVTVYIPLRNVSAVTDIPSLILRELAVGGLDQAGAKKRLLAWIKQLDAGDELLLVMDNLDDILEADQTGLVKLIQEIQSVSQKVYFLFTSRKKFSDPNLDIKSIRVSPLDTENASNMICKLSSNVSKEESDYLASLCGCLPLALKLIGSLLYEGICQAKELISELEKSRSGKMNALWDDAFTDDWQVSSVIRTSFDKLTNDSAKVLITLGVFPGNFKREIAIKIVTEVVKFEEKGPSTKRTIQKTIQALCNRSLLEYDPQSQQLQIHPLVQSYLEHTATDHPQLGPLWKASDYSFTKCYVEMTDYLCGVYWSRDGAKHAMEEFQRERKNLEYVLRRPIPQEFHPSVLKLVEGSFLFFRISMSHENCIDFVKNCKVLAQQCHGYASLDSLFFQLLETTLHGLKGDARVAAMVEKSQEELDKYTGVVTAIKNDREALLCVFVGLLHLIRRDFKNSPQFAITSIEWLTKNAPNTRLLGFAHRMLGVTGQDNIARTLDHYYKALDIQEKLLGENPETMMIYHNIGSTLLRQGEHQKAVEHFLSAYRMSINLRLNEHEDTTTILGDMAEAYRCQGKHNEAKRCLHEALKVIGTVGVYRTSVWCYKYLARVLRDQNNFNEALEYLDKALVLSKEAFSQQHNPHFTDISIDKANIYANNLGKLLEALQLHEDCLIYDKQFNIPISGRGRCKLLSREVKDYDLAFDEIIHKVDSSTYETSLCIKAHQKAAAIYQLKGNSSASQFHLDVASKLQS